MNDNFTAFHTTEYDDKIKRTLPYYEELYQQVIEVVQLHNANMLTWLDVGCGTGKMADAALSQTKIEKFVFCDCSAEMIEIAKKRFPISDVNAEFLVAKVQELTFQEEFDVITAIQVNHYLQKDERVTAIKKCYEALKTGGIFISFENFAPFSDIARKLYLDRWKAYQLEQGKSNVESEAHIRRYNQEYFPISLSEQLQVLENCGFQAVEILWLSYMQAGFIGIK